MASNREASSLRARQPVTTCSEPMGGSDRGQSGGDSPNPGTPNPIPSPQPSAYSAPGGFYSDPSTLSPVMREWSRIGDFMTGRYDSSTGLWAASRPSSRNRNVPLNSIVGDRFLNSHHSPPMTNSGTYQDSYPNVLGFMPNRLSSGEGLRAVNFHLSPRLPHRLWKVLAKILGITQNRYDKPVLATFLHVFTLLTALLFAIPGAWYTIFDIRSKFSKTTVLLGSAQLIIGFAWASMGVYSHNLAGRLFSNKNFLDCVRGHSKTFLKISTTWLTLVLGALVIAVNCYEAAPPFINGTCSTAEVELEVCEAYFAGRVVYASISLFWNFIVIYALFSVCRTHTVGIRRFMGELNADAKVYELFCLKQYNLQRTKPYLEESWCLWDDTDDSEMDRENPVLLQSMRTLSIRRHQQFHLSRASAPHDIEEDEGHSNGSDSANVSATDQADHDNQAFDSIGDVEALHSASEAKDDGEAESDGASEHKPDERDEQFTASHAMSEVSSYVGGHVLFTNEDLLFSYWKFLRRLTVTSRLLQRWMASWIAFVVMWDGYFIIYWTSHPATLVGIVQFVVPLLILLLVCSAYAEVNAEGQRLLKTICPLEERMAIIFYFNQQPLTVRVFSFTVTYNAMMTVILAFSVAFASRMILDEISRNT